VAAAELLHGLVRRPGQLQRDVHPAPPVLGADVGLQRDAGGGLCTYEGSLSFVTVIYFLYRDSPYKRERGRYDDRRPSSKRAASEMMATSFLPACPSEYHITRPLAPPYSLHTVLLKVESCTGGARLEGLVLGDVALGGPAALQKFEKS
jgi:hypothetical protein